MSDGPTASELSSYLDEVVASARVLATLTEAAAAEAWASGAVAEWFRLGRTDLADRLSGRAAVAEAVIRYIESGVVPESQGAPWTADVGSARPVAGVRLYDPTRADEVVRIVEFEADSGARHDVSVTFLGERVVDVAVAPTGLSRAAGEAARFVTEPIESPSLGDIRSALDATRPSDLTDRARLDLPLLCRRSGFDPADVFDLVAGTGVDDAAPPLDLGRAAEDDAYAAELVRSALAEEGRPAQLAEAVDEFVGRVAAGDADALAAMAVAGVTADDVDSDPEAALVRTAGAYLAPTDLSPHPRDEQSPIAALEPADWVGVVLGVMRERDSTPLTGAVAVAYVNRCPEIATSIPARDAESVAWAFDRTFYAWEITGVLDDRGLLTEAGRWILPQAVRRAWSG